MTRVFVRLCTNIMACAGILCSGAAQSGTVNILYCFGGYGDGTTPYAGMIGVKNVIYGTTYYGGTGKCSSDFGNNCGIIFSFDPATKKERVIYSFQGGADGELPASRLTYLNGLLYGTTAQGGSGSCSTSFGSGCGTVFSFDPVTGAEKVLYTFSDLSGGAYPYNAVVVPSYGSTDLYGTTTLGGSGNCEQGCGIVFKVSLSKGTETLVHSFQNDGKDGMYPGSAGWALYKGKLYGTTNQGGAYGYGTIYSIDPGTGAERVVHAFGKGKDGASPLGGMTSLGNMLYGTTSNGGGRGYGTVFSLDPATGDEKVLISFSGKDGGFPVTDLIQAKKRLYGTTVDPNEQGTVFSVNPRTGSEIDYGNIGGTENPYENTQLTQAAGLYGTATESESCFYSGAIYSVTR